MRWYTWVLAPLLTAFFGLFAAGTLAALLLDWYNVSSFEGGSGFFVVFIALFGWIAGLVVGLIAAIVVARRTAPGFLKAVGYGWGASLLIVLVIGAGARLLADIPPELLERAEAVGEGHRLVVRVLVIEIDAVDPEPLK